MGPIGCAEKPLRKNCHYSLSNGPEEPSTHLLRGGSLKSRIILRVAVHGRENWSRILKDDCRMEFFINQLLRISYGPTEVKVTEDC